MSCIRPEKVNNMVMVNGHCEQCGLCQHHGYCDHSDLYDHRGQFIKHICDTIEYQECPELPDPPNGQVHLTGRHFQVIFIKHFVNSSSIHEYILTTKHAPVQEKLPKTIWETLADIFCFIPISPLSKPPGVQLYKTFAFYSIWEPQFYASALNSTMNINLIGKRKEE